MRTPEDHLLEVAQLLPRHPSRAVPLSQALGARLVSDIHAVVDSPRFDNSQMDGYALSLAQVHQTPASFPAGPTIPAGTDPDAHYPQGLADQIAPIMTGAKLPAGTAAIVPVEKCEPGQFVATGGQVTVPQIPEGQFIRPAGSDITTGEPLLNAGATIDPVAIGVLAGQGIERVEVTAPARVVLCTGGAEVGGGGDAVASIPDSNGPMLQALCERAGIQVAARVLTNDDLGQLRADLGAAVTEHSPTAIITSGGISHGKFEVIRQLLEPQGWFGHVSQQPGGPQGLSTFRGTPVISLPGNPISTMVSFRLFVAPLLGIAPEPVAARLSEDIRGLPDRDQFLRGRLYVDEMEVHRVGSVGGAGSHLLAQALTANCLIHIKAPGHYSADMRVTAYPL